jgi:hypothetical protein
VREGKDYAIIVFPDDKNSSPDENSPPDEISLPSSNPNPRCRT